MTDRGFRSDLCFLSTWPSSFTGSDCVQGLAEKRQSDRRDPTPRHTRDEAERFAGCPEPDIATIRKAFITEDGTRRRPHVSEHSVYREKIVPAAARGRLE